MAQAVGRWHLSPKTRFRSQATPCGICGGQNDTGSIIPLMLQIHLSNLLPMLQSLGNWECV